MKRSCTPHAAGTRRTIMPPPAPLVPPGTKQLAVLAVLLASVSQASPPADSLLGGSPGNRSAPAASPATEPEPQDASGDSAARQSQAARQSKAARPSQAARQPGRSRKASTADRTAGPRGGDWPRFLGYSFDGTSPVSIAASDVSGASDANGASDASGGPRRPEVRWSLPVGEGYGLGAIADGRYYHFDATLDRAARIRHERLRCIDLATGETLWTRTSPLFYRDLYGYEAGPRSTPTIAGDQIFTFGVAGRLTCRNRRDGRELWSVDTHAKYGVVQNFFGVACSPLVLGEAVIVMVGGSPPEDAQVAPGRLDRVSPNGSAVVAFDRRSGQPLWKTGEDLASYSSPRPVEIGGETLVLVFARGGLMAIDPADGRVRWRFDHRADKIESVNAIMPVVDGNRVFISECYGVGGAVLRFTPHEFEVVWRDPPGNRRAQAMRCHWSTPALIDGYLYGCSGRNAPDSDFRCVDFDTGEVMWTAPWRQRCSVTRVGDLLVVMRERGLLQVIRPNPEKLEVVAEWPMTESAGEHPALRYPCWAAPVVVEGHCLVRGDRHVLSLAWPES